MIRSKSITPGQKNGKSGPARPAVPSGNGDRRAPGKRPVLARILLAHGDLASRLTLSTILSAGGYAVDSAASAAEAIDRLDKGEYQLVLADLRAEGEEAGQRILAYSRQKCYRPATALVTSFLPQGISNDPPDQQHQIAVHDEDVSAMLDRVAELIGLRASRRVRSRMLRRAG